MPRKVNFDLGRFDWILLGASLLLVSFGLSALYSTSLVGSSSGLAGAAAEADFGNFWKQVWFALGGLALAFALPAFDYRSLSRMSRLLAAVAAGLLLAVLIFGTTVRGTTGWFGIGGFGIQPVEVVKLILIVWLAKHFSDYAGKGKGLKHIMVSGLVVGSLAGLVLLQPDFGSAFLLISVWAVMLVVSGIRRTYLMAMAGMFLVTAAIAWLFVLQPYQKDRITSFLDPESDALGRGYNVAQSIIAIGSGGVTGQGMGYGSQSQLRFLPERQTDFIFAVIAEEFGFLGVLLLLAMFMVIVWRGYRLAMTASDDFTLYLSLGITAAICLEVMVNLGGNLRLLPVTGVTLPFVSYGGSSLLAKFMMIGVLQSVAMRARGGSR